VGRAWWSTCQLRYRNHLVLPGLATQTAAISHGLTNTFIGAIGEIDDEVYAVWNGTPSESPVLYKYDNSAGSWGSALVHSITDQVTDTITWTAINGTTYLVFAHYDANGSGYTYYSTLTTTLDGAISSTGATSVPVDDASGLVVGQIIVVGSEHMTITAISTNTLTVTRASNSTTAATHSDGATVSLGWTTDAQDTEFLTVWDDRLWGISNTGQLWWAITAGDETTDAKIPLPDDYVTGMFVARDAGGEPIIYVATKKGLFAHDAANQRFIETQLFLPFHPDAGKG